MATVAVPVCPGANQTIDPTTGAFECTVGTGSWQQVTLVDPWDPSMLSLDELGGAYAAGFSVMGTGCALMLGIALVVRSFMGN